MATSWRRPPACTGDSSSGGITAGGVSTTEDSQGGTRPHIYGCTSDTGSDSESSSSHGGHRGGCDSSADSSSETGEDREAYGIVHVVQMAGEWAGLETSMGSTGSSTVSPRRGHLTRYKDMAQAIEAAEQGKVNSRGSIKAEALGKLHAVVGVLLFCAIYLRVTTCSLVLRYRVRTQGWEELYTFDGISLIFLLLLDAVFIVFQTICVRRDRILAMKRLKYWEEGSYLKLAAANFYSWVILGLLCFWQLLRSARQIRTPSYRDSFLLELSDPAMLSDCAQRMPRYSSHLTFIFEMPFVAILTYAFARRSTEIAMEGFARTDLISMPAWILCFQILICAQLAFDHSVSKTVQNLYATRPACGFPMVHYVYRSAEVLAGFLVIGATMLLAPKRPWLVAIWWITIWATKFFALCWASGAVSKRAMFVSIPYAVINLTLFVDRQDLLEPAWVTTLVFDIIRGWSVVAAVVIYCDRLNEVGAVTALSFMLAASVTTCLLRWLQIVRPKDLQREEGSVTEATTIKRQQTASSLYGKRLDERYMSTDFNTLAEHLFSKGIGDQFASLVEILCETQEDHLRLSRLIPADKLGQGGFGSVYKVRNGSSGEFYALKLQRKDGKADYAVREAEALHDSPHFFIVRLVRVFRTSEFFGILLELCDKDLNRCILEWPSARPSSPSPSQPSVVAEGLPKAHCQHYSACMLLALEFLHDRRIVFRDLKPENVLTVAAPGAAPVGSHVKLADFGLARAVDAGSGAGDENPAAAADDDLGEVDEVSSGDDDDLESGKERRHCEAAGPKITERIGTPAFMPAEAYDSSLAACDADQTLRVVASRDWYALGCCLLLMLRGQRGCRRVTSGREVLLPPHADEISRVLLEAMAEGDTDRHALVLAHALTVEDCSARAGAREMRASPFLSEAVPRAETFVRSAPPPPLRTSSR